MPINGKRCCAGDMGAYYPDFMVCIIYRSIPGKFLRDNKSSLQTVTHNLKCQRESGFSSFSKINAAAISSQQSWPFMRKLCIIHLHPYIWCTSSLTGQPLLTKKAREGVVNEPSSSYPVPLGMHHIMKAHQVKVMQACKNHHAHYLKSTTRSCDPNFTGISCMEPFE